MSSTSLGAKRQAIGLDIGTDHLRVAQIKRSGSGGVLEAYGRIETPAGAVVDGEITNVAAVSAAIGTLMQRTHIHGKDVCTGVANQRVVVRLIDMPPLESADLKSAIQFQAQEYIPMAVEDAVIDFQAVGEYTVGTDQRMLEVVLAAADRGMIGNVVAAVEGAELRPVKIDVSSFALVRALLGDPVTPVLSDGGATTAIVHIGSGLTTIAIVERGYPRFNRVSSLGGKALTAGVASDLGVEFGQAEALKIAVGLPGEASGPVSVAGIDAERVATVQTALVREAGKFVAEIRRSLDYYLTQSSHAKRVDRIILSGSGSALPGLAPFLKSHLQTDVIVGDPLSQITLTAGAKAIVDADALGCVTAIGLALGGLQA